jgi:hypothetical protein
VLGREHPETAATYTVIARIYLRRAQDSVGFCERAERPLRQALASQMRLLGGMHPSIAKTEDELGLVMALLAT